MEEDEEDDMEQTTNASDHAMERKRRPMWRTVVRCATVVALGFVLWRAGDILLWRNLGTITAGQAYRSNQLTGAGFRKEITALGLKSVINLRGACPKEDWYRDEVAVCQASGVSHYDIHMSATKLPPPETVALLIRTLHEAPRPVLIHCKQGADRTGLAAAAWLIMEEGQTPSKATFLGLTAWHGHFPVGGVGAMDRFFRLYAETGQGMDFEKWALIVYPDVWKKTANVKGMTNL